MKAKKLIDEVMTKAQTLEGDQLEKFFLLICAMSIGVLRGIHDDEFIDDFLAAAKKDGLTITPHKVN